MKDIIGVVHVWWRGWFNLQEPMLIMSKFQNHAFMHRWTPDTSGLYYIMAGKDIDPWVNFDEFIPQEAKFRFRKISTKSQRKPC